MTNFLNRIAGRALGVIPLAQPLLPARFDPTVEKSGREGFSVSRSATSSAEWDLAVAQETMRPYEDKNPPRTMARFREPTSAHAIQAASNLPLGAELNSSRPEPENEKSHPAPPFADQRQHAAQMNSQPTSALPAVWSEVFRPESQRNPHGAFGSRMDGAMAGPAHKAPHSLVPGQRSPLAAPAVRVTIGRIDVRAELTSPLAPATRRTRPSALSLDQFLKQRSGAGR